MFESQATWQKERKSLSWSAKIRTVEAIQGSIRQLRKFTERWCVLRVADSAKSGGSDITSFDSDDKSADSRP